MMMMMMKQFQQSSQPQSAPMGHAPPTPNPPAWAPPPPPPRDDIVWDPRSRKWVEWDRRPVKSKVSTPEDTSEGGSESTQDEDDGDFTIEHFEAEMEELGPEKARQFFLDLCAKHGVDVNKLNGLATDDGA